MKALTRKPPNPGLQRTALCAHKIGAILTVGFSPTVFPIYDCAAAEAQPVKPNPLGGNPSALVLIRRFRSCYN